MNARATLPAVLQEIAEVAGLDAAWALARAKGGTTIFLPRRVGPRHWLSGIVGYEAARKICDHFRSNHQERVVVPMAAASQRDTRWREAIAEELSINETAERLGVHGRTVSRHRARLTKKTSGNQGNLF